MKRQPNTLDCHRLIRWADGIGKAAEMKQRLMDLYFTEGADLTDRAVLVQAAADVGLDAEDVRARSRATRTSRRSSRKRSRPRKPASRACPASSSAASSRCRARRRRNISPRRSSAWRRPTRSRRIARTRQAMQITAAVVRERSAPFQHRAGRSRAIRAPTNCWSRSSPPACARPICTAATATTPTHFPGGVRPRRRRHRARDRQRGDRRSSPATMW